MLLRDHWEMTNNFSRIVGGKMSSILELEGWERDGGEQKEEIVTTDDGGGGAT